MPSSIDKDPCEDWCRQQRQKQQRFDSNKDIALKKLGTGSRTTKAAWDEGTSPKLDLDKLTPEQREQLKNIRLPHPHAKDSISQTAQEPAQEPAKTPNKTSAPPPTAPKKAFDPERDCDCAQQQPNA